MPARTRNCLSFVFMFRVPLTYTYNIRSVASRQDGVLPSDRPRSRGQNDAIAVLRSGRRTSQGERKNMNGEAVSSFIQLLSRFDPPWVLVIVAVAILCYRASDIVKAFR